MCVYEFFLFYCRSLIVLALIYLVLCKTFKTDRFDSWLHLSPIKNTNKRQIMVSTLDGHYQFVLMLHVIFSKRYFFAHFVFLRYSTYAPTDCLLACSPARLSACLSFVSFISFMFHSFYGWLSWYGIGLRGYIFSFLCVGLLFGNGSSDDSIMHTKSPEKIYT